MYSTQHLMRSWERCFFSSLGGFAAMCITSHKFFSKRRAFSHAIPRNKLTQMSKEHCRLLVVVMAPGLGVLWGRGECDLPLQSLNGLFILDFKHGVPCCSKIFAAEPRSSIIPNRRTTMWLQTRSRALGGEWKNISLCRLWFAPSSNWHSSSVKYHHMAQKLSRQSREFLNRPKECTTKRWHNVLLPASFSFCHRLHS